MAKIKQKRIDIRCSLEEHSMIKNQAKKYGTSVSQLVIDSVSTFNVAGERNKINTYIRLAEIFERYEVELRRIGNNINQLSRAANRSLLNNTEICFEETIDEMVRFRNYMENILENY